MDARLEQIVGLVSRSVAAADANSAIDEARRGLGSGEGLARSYELVLPGDATFDSFVRDQVPKLIYHLESIGAHPPRAAGVLLCLFVGDRLHLVRAGDLLKTLCGLLEISPAELVRRYGTGERRTAAPAALSALPPPRGDD